MFKQVLFAVFTATTVLFSTPLMAQMQGPSQAPAGGQESAPEVSDAELEKFVNALNKVNQVQEQYQGEMVQQVEKSGLDVERFNEIANAQQNPNQEVEASEKELANFQTAVEKISSTQQEMQSELQNAVVDAGMQPTRYQQIMNQVNQDPALQQKVQSMME
ncbi:MAG: DUF4168 domain-containing protein [Chitinophagales bacterium]